jgi:hypothetical protein
LIDAALETGRSFREAGFRLLEDQSEYGSCFSRPQNALSSFDIRPAYRRGIGKNEVWRRLPIHDIVVASFSLVGEVHGPDISLCVCSGKAEAAGSPQSDQHIAARDDALCCVALDKERIGSCDIAHRGKHPHSFSVISNEGVRKRL